MDEDKKRQPSQEKGKLIPSFKDYMREFPLGLPEEILNTMKKFPTLTNHFNEHLEMVKLYRPSLGSNLQNCWVDVMVFIKRLVGQINTIVKNVREDCDSKLENIIKTTTELETQNKRLKDRIDRLETLRQLESQDLNLADIETESLKREIFSIYDIMQRDMKRILDYLVNVEKSQQSETSSSMFIGLERLANSIKLLQEERNNTSSALGSMNELIKAMAKNGKTDSCTQVEQSELQWKAKDVFPVEKNKKVSLDEVERSSINIEGNLDKNLQKQHIISQMQIKEKEFPPEIYNPKKNVEKPWVLPPTLLVFMENMSKENQNGRVLPWQHVKKTIYEIYQERITHSRELLGGLVGNVTSFDEFFVLYFIKKYNIRRLAEIKMLELIISIKYYTKFWPKAQMFAYMLDIMRFQPSFEVNQTNGYKFDLYLQSFFFSVFVRLFDGEIIQWEDGATFASFSRIKNIMKRFLFFTDQLSRSRLFARLQKSIRLKAKKEYADLDYALQLIVDEYFACRKRNLSVLSKAFSKTSQTIQGYFSLKEITNLFRELQNVYSQGSGFGVKYPVDSTLQLCKLYLYSITSGKNNFEVNGKEFLTSCQRFGFDSPFPFIHICSAVDLTYKDRSQELQPVSSSQVSKIVKKSENVEVQVVGQTVEEPVKQDVVQPQPTNLSSIAAKRVEIGSIIFSQHFSILRELREYCVVFKETLSGEKDLGKVWSDFEKILHILDKGCQFLRFPLKT